MEAFHSHLGEHHKGLEPVPLVVVVVEPHSHHIRSLAAADSSQMLEPELLDPRKERHP